MKHPSPAAAIAHSSSEKIAGFVHTLIDDHASPICGGGLDWDQDASVPVITLYVHEGKVYTGPAEYEGLPIRAREAHQLHPEADALAL